MVKVRVMIASVPQDTIVVSRARMQAILDGLDRADRGLAASSRLAREISDTFEDTSMFCVVIRCSCGVAIHRSCHVSILWSSDMPLLYGSECVRSHMHSLAICRSCKVANVSAIVPCRSAAVRCHYIASIRYCGLAICRSCMVANVFAIVVGVWSKY